MSPTKILLVVIFILFPIATLAQQKRVDVFADPENLKVLPEDISSEDLSATMRGFAMGLGVRCETCHVGEPNTPLHTFDFASDEKPMKQKARLMLEMVSEKAGNEVDRQVILFLTQSEISHTEEILDAAVGRFNEWTLAKVGAEFSRGAGMTPALFKWGFR